MYLIFKRLIDVLVSLVILLFLFPFLILVVFLIKIDSKGPIFYLQSRVGKNGHLFKVYKFRTMTNKQRDPNVFVGDMSLVGPRPALPSLYEKYGDLANKRCCVRPGMTGWAQVNGNIYLPWEKRLLLDSEYVDRISFMFDLRILVKTVAIVLLGEDKFIKK